MPITVTPIHSLDDATNAIRIKTAAIVNNEILPREGELFPQRQGTAVTPEMKTAAKHAREEVKAKVKEAGLWAPHLPQEYGGMGDVEFQEALTTSLASFKIPSKIAFTDSPLPRNPAGKVLKRTLRETYFTEAG